MIYAALEPRDEIHCSSAVGRPPLDCNLFRTQNSHGIKTLLERFHVVAEASSDGGGEMNPLRDLNWKETSGGQNKNRG